MIYERSILAVAIFAVRIGVSLMTWRAEAIA